MNTLNKKQKWLRFMFGLVLIILIVATYAAWLSYFDRQVVVIDNKEVTLPLPSLEPFLHKRVSLPEYDPVLSSLGQRLLALERRGILAAIRAERIAKVERFFEAYGAPLAGYAHIIVDQAAACGGDYAILVGIAGSESGLGRINYKKYNPYGFLNGVEYANQEEALTILSCLVSERHLVHCGQDLNCLARRYAGPNDDKQLFISKVRWFANQVR